MSQRKKWRYINIAAIDIILAGAKCIAEINGEFYLVVLISFLQNWLELQKAKI